MSEEPGFCVAENVAQGRAAQIMMMSACLSPEQSSSGAKQNGKAGRQETLELDLLGLQTANWHNCCCSCLNMIFRNWRPRKVGKAVRI